jgi:hypothetical protein
MKPPAARLIRRFNSKTILLLPTIPALYDRPISPEGPDLTSTALSCRSVCTWVLVGIKKDKFEGRDMRLYQVDLDHHTNSSNLICAEFPGRARE